MKEFTKWILKHQKLIMILIILIDVVSLFFVVSRFSISTDLLASFAKGFKVNKDFERISNKYESQNTIILAIEKNNILSKSNLLEIYDFKNDLKSIKYISYIRSFLPDKFLKSLVFIDVNKTTIDENYQQIVDFVKKINSDSYTSNSGLFFITLKKDSNAIKAIDSIFTVTKRYGYKVHLSGNAVMSYYIFKYLIWIVCILIPLVALVLLVVFDLAIGNFKAALLSLMPAGMAALWTFGVIFLTSQSLSIVTVVVPMFIIIMGSADGLHITSHFISESRGSSPSEAIIKTMDMVGLSVVLTTITTILGFLSLTFTSLDFLRQMGLYTSVGIAFAGIISWTFLPLVLSKTTFKKVRKVSVKASPLIDFFIAATKRKKLVFTLLLIIAVIFASFIPQLKVCSEQSGLFKPYTKVVEDMNYFKSNYGFSNTDMIEFRTNSKNLFDLNVKKEILKFESQLNSLKGVEKTVSFMDLENKVKKNVGNSFMEELVIRRMIDEKIFPLEQWADSKGNYKILLQLSSGNEKVMSEIENFIKKYPNVTFTGPDYVFYKLNQIVVRDQIESLLTAIIMVFLLMLLIYRNFTIAFKSIIPILYTILLFFGFLRISGFNLNIVIADIASIAIGIGIDYSIHFMGEYKYFNRDLKKTIENVSVPIIANAAGLTLGIMVLLFSPLEIHLYVSVGIAFTMIVSSVATLLILPLVLKTKSEERP